MLACPAQQQLCLGRRTAVCLGVQVGAGSFLRHGARSQAGSATLPVAGLIAPSARLRGAVHQHGGLGTRQPVQCSSSPSDEQKPAKSSGPDATDTLITVVLFGLYIVLMGYVLVLSPNQTPTRDTIIIEKLLNLKPDEPYVVNQIFTGIWNSLGIYPAVMAALMIPAARSNNKIPVWPFTVVSFALGCYALIPYMILWTPKQPPEQLPPSKQDLEGWNKLLWRFNENGVAPALLLVGALLTYYGWATLPEGALRGYLQLFDESRLVHASSIDFALFTLLTPYWMANDAEARNWGPRNLAVPALSFLPLVGPLLYLLLRPKGGQEQPQQ